MHKSIINVFLIASCFSVVLSSCSDSKKAEITAFEVPSRYTEERKENKGSIVKVDYTTKDYLSDSGKTEDKYCNVYLPYNYDSSMQYDIIYLLHGTDPQSVVHQNTWFDTIGVKNILDNMIYYQDIKPVIVVAPTFYCYGLYGDDNMKSIREMSPVKEKSNENFKYELRNDIVPAIESKYSTYASTDDEDGYVSSRDHRALCGLSNGCRITLNSGMVANFDYFSYFGCYSSSADSKNILDAMHSDKFKDLKLNYMYNSDGIYDFAYNAHKKMVNELLEDEKFDEKNTEYNEIAFGYHSARSWRVSFYNSLQRFFK